MSLQSTTEQSLSDKIQELSLKIGLWPREPLRIHEDHLDDLLLWSAQNRSSDTNFQTDNPVYIEVDGILFPVTRRSLDSADMANVISRIYGADALAKLASGRDLDLSYEVRPDRNTRVRFRVNITAILSRGRDSVQVTMRTLPSLPPTLKDLGVEEKIVENWAPRQGMVLVTGPTGSGKSTLLAAGCRMLIERARGLRQDADLRSADRICLRRDYAGRARWWRNRKSPAICRPLRRACATLCAANPRIIMVGEARDRETVTAAIEAGQTGHLVYSTVHTIGVAATVRRMVSVFDPAERTERAYAMMETLRMIVTQALVPKIGGGRIGLREYLVFDDNVRETLLDMSIERWTSETQRLLLRYGQTMEQTATKTFKAGIIDRRTYLLLIKGFSGDDVDGGVLDEKETLTIDDF